MRRSYSAARNQRIIAQADHARRMREAERIIYAAQERRGQQTQAEPPPQQQSPQVAP